MTDGAGYLDGPGTQQVISGGARPSDPLVTVVVTHRVSPDTQGELQGAVASLYSLSSIVGPPIMTQLFGHFSAADASPRITGAAFFASATLAIACLAIYAWVTREAPKLGSESNIIKSS